MSRKKICLVGPPFSGHLHPLLGIGLHLQGECEVTVVTTPGGVAEAVAAGLDALPILAEREQAVWAIAEPGQSVKGNPVLLYRQLKENVALLACMKAELDGVFGALKPDLVIADFTVPVAGISATALGIPWWTTSPSPCVFETPDGPPAYFGGLHPAGNRWQELLHAALRMATRNFKRGMGWWFRRELRAIGFQGIYRADGSEAVYSPGSILGLSNPEIEFVRSYPAHFHCIGPVLHSPAADIPEPEFVDDGRPRILVTLGTHLVHEKAKLARTIRAMARRHPQLVFHFSDGKQTGDHGIAEENFHHHSYISYRRDLPRYDLVIHHAGSGVLNHCLYHGKPSVLLPLDFDQFDNAARLVAAGVGVRARQPADLERLVLEALADEALHERCRQMAEIQKSHDAPEFILRRVREL